MLPGKFLPANDNVPPVSEPVGMPRASEPDAMSWGEMIILAGLGVIAALFANICSGGV